MLITSPALLLTVFLLQGFDYVANSSENVCARVCACACDPGLKRETAYQRQQLSLMGAL